MPPKRKVKKELHPPHVDEKWLVSYSDMMTLLFGFFVLMFTIASQNKGEVTASLKEIADEMKEGNPKKSLPHEIKIEIDKNEFDNLKMKQFELDSLKIKFMEVSKNLNELQTKHLQLLEKQTSKESLPIENLNTLNNQIQKLKDQSQKDQKQIKDLEEKIDKTKKQVKELEKKQGGDNKQNYLMTFIQWNSEKHDLDMVIKDPNGKIFNFKKRKYENYTGEFILDSRYGPGAEIWNSPDLIPGTYTISIILYNQYGNLHDSIVTGSILSSQGRVNLPEVHLNLKSHPSHSIHFNVNKDGLINFLD